MLSIQNISYQYPKSKVNSLESISFEINSGDYLAIIGESGCGKSTLLKAIYGLIDLKEGEILIENTPVLGPAFNLVPGHQHMKYLAQDFDLMPFVKVKENVGKFLSNFFLEEKAKKTSELLALVDMSDYAETMTNQLSGGQKQRVALAQALAQEPKLLLLDEPFSHIDHFRKNTLRRHLFQYLKEKNIACIVATHDMEEVLPFADEILVLKNGKKIQSSQTQNIYENPFNLDVAKLFGDAFEISNELAIKLKANEKKILYPHQLTVNEKDGANAKILKKYFYGSYYLYEAVCENELVMFKEINDLAVNENIKLSYDKKV